MYCYSLRSSFEGSGQMNVMSFPRRQILFVSNGGICRAPMAVGVLNRLLREKGCTQPIHLASAAICDIHVGMPPDPMAIEAAAARGCDIREIRVRRIEIGDFHAATILAVDALILSALRDLAPHGLGGRPQLLARHSGMGLDDIVDPYGGSATDYQFALNLIEASCRGLAATLLVGS